MITPSLLRHINALRCLRVLQGGQNLSRADMARALGLTRATIGHAVAELAEAGLVVETEGRSPNPIGRPGVALRLNPKGAQFIGIEIDTRAIHGVLVSLDMAVTHRANVATGPDFHDPSAMQARIVALALHLADQNRGVPLHGLGLAVPGLVGHGGQIVNAPLLGWRNVAMRHVLTQSLPDTWAVDVCNDAFAFASAELVDRDTPRLNLLMVLLAEGVGSAYVADGHLVAGAHGFAGELGHMQIFAQGRVDRFEAFAGIAGFDQGAGQGMPVAEAVAALIAAKDHPDTKAALDRWAGALCVGLANAAHLLDPDRIVLGGPLSALYPLVCAKVEAGLAALMLQGHASPTLHLARFGAEGAAIGAAARLRARLFALPDLDQPRLAQSA